MSAIQEAILWGVLCLNGGSPVAWVDREGAHTLSRFHVIHQWGYANRGIDYKTYTESTMRWQVVKYTKSMFTPLEPWTRMDSIHDEQGFVVSWEDSE